MGRFSNITKKLGYNKQVNKNNDDKYNFVFDNKNLLSTSQKIDVQRIVDDYESERYDYSSERKGRIFNIEPLETMPNGHTIAKCIMCIVELDAEYCSYYSEPRIAFIVLDQDNNLIAYTDELNSFNNDSIIINTFRKPISLKQAINDSAIELRCGKNAILNKATGKFNPVMERLYYDSQGIYSKNIISIQERTYYSLNGEPEKVVVGTFNNDKLSKAYSEIKPDDRTL